jgi:hypothetical protein
MHKVIEEVELKNRNSIYKVYELVNQNGTFTHKEDLNLDIEDYINEQNINVALNLLKKISKEEAGPLDYLSSISLILSNPNK